VQIDLLVFQAAPQPLDEDVVHAAAFPIHADRDAGSLEHAGEVDARAAWSTGSLRGHIIDRGSRPVGLLSSN
jgi:hypothetical protein